MTGIHSCYNQNTVKLIAEGRPFSRTGDGNGQMKTLPRETPGACTAHAAKIGPRCRVFSTDNGDTRRPAFFGFCQHSHKLKRVFKRGLLTVIQAKKSKQKRKRWTMVGKGKKTKKSASAPAAGAAAAAAGSGDSTGGKDKTMMTEALRKRILKQPMNTLEVAMFNEWKKEALKNKPEDVDADVYINELMQKAVGSKPKAGKGKEKNETKSKPATRATKAKGGTATGEETDRGTQVAVGSSGEDTGTSGGVAKKRNKVGDAVEPTDQSPEVEVEAEKDPAGVSGEAALAPTEQAKTGNSGGDGEEAAATGGDATAAGASNGPSESSQTTVEDVVGQDGGTGGGVVGVEFE